MKDLVCVVAPQNVHWVLDRIAHEVGERFGGEVDYCYDVDSLPVARHYFVTHYSLLPRVLAQVNPAKARIHCFFTHESVPVSTLRDTMNLCASVICENGTEFHRLIDYGILPDILHMVPECSNPAMFRPHARTGNGDILISSACYPRKNPDLLLQVMEVLSNRSFIIVGKDWPVDRLPANCKYLERVDYDKYPKLYEDCDVFLSCAKLEGGGPGGLIESMHANLVPVVSDTGNAREYIVDGYNGYIFPVNSQPEEVADLIEKAYLLHPENSMPYADIWQTVRDYTWDRYALQMKEIFTNDFSTTASQTLDNADDEDTSHITRSDN